MQRNNQAVASISREPIVSETTASYDLVERTEYEEHRFRKAEEGQEGMTRDTNLTLDAVKAKYVNQPALWSFVISCVVFLLYLVGLFVRRNCSSVSARLDIGGSHGKSNWYPLESLDWNCAAIHLVNGRLILPLNGFDMNRYFPLFSSSIVECELAFAENFERDPC